jgi:hypothetical protein
MPRIVNSVSTDNQPQAKEHHVSIPDSRARRRRHGHHDRSQKQRLVPRQIEKATVLTFTDDVIATLIGAGEIHGPHKTIADLFTKRTALLT